MYEISILLKDARLLTQEEYKALVRYSSHGRVWTVIERYGQRLEYTARKLSPEYIFEPEALTLFRLISCNILAQWYTDNTRNLHPNQEFQIHDTLWIRPTDQPLHRL